MLQYSGNKKRVAMMNSNEPFPVKTLLWVPNPNGKLHILDGLDGRLVLDEAQYKQYIKNVHRVMDKMQMSMQQDLGYATGRHDDLKALNDDQWFVSSVVGVFSDVPEPKKSRKEAEAAYQKMLAVVKSRNYAKFQVAAERAEKALVIYQNDVNKWTGDMINTAEGTVKNLKRAKKAGAFCGTVVAVTVAAPASLTAAVVTGGLSSGGVNLAYDGFDQIGRTTTGVKPRSLKDLRSRFLTNVATGAGGALLAGGLLKHVGGPLVTALLSKPSIAKLSVKFAERAIVQRVFEKEANILANQLAKKGSKISVEEYIKVMTHDRVMTQALTKWMVRSGSGGLVKFFEADKKALNELKSWIAANPDKMGGKDVNKVSAAVAADFAKSKAGAQLVEDYLAANMKEFRVQMRKEMQAAASAAASRAK